MTALVLTYPNLNPVALRFGPLVIHWYGVMYMLAFIIGYVLLRRRVRHEPYAYVTSRTRANPRGRSTTSAR